MPEHIYEYPSPRAYANYCRRQLVKRWKAEWPDWAGHRISGEPFKLADCDKKYLREYRLDMMRSLGRSIFMFARSAGQENAIEARIVQGIPPSFRFR